ncbi:MAG: AI-2E family transporter [Polyangiales bacterium]
METPRPDSPVRPLISIGPPASLAVLALLGCGAIVYVSSNVAVGLLLGVVMAFVAEPLSRKLTRLLHGRARAAALLTTTAVSLVAVAGVLAAVWVVASETMAVAREVQIRAATEPLDTLIGHGGVRILDAFHVPRPWVLTQVRAGASHLQAFAAPVLTGVVTSTGAGLITGVITFATMYYALFQWEAAARRIENILPIRPRYTRVLLEEFQSVGRSALVSTLGTALIQGLLATVGYALTGVPRAALWGLATGVLAFLPVGGTMLVWAPSTLYLLSSNRNGAAAALFVWSVLAVVMLPDYVIRPRLVGRTSPVHPLLVLVALLGGVETFGLWGVLIGPVLMSVCVATVRLYESEFARGRARLASL